MKFSVIDVAKLYGVSDQSVLDYMKRKDRALIGERDKHGLRWRWVFSEVEVKAFAEHHGIEVDWSQVESEE